jgi:hypothetical protein
MNQVQSDSDEAIRNEWKDRLQARAPGSQSSKWIGTVRGIEGDKLLRWLFAELGLRFSVAEYPQSIQALAEHIFLQRVRIEALEVQAARSTEALEALAEMCLDLRHDVVTSPVAEPGRSGQSDEQSSAAANGGGDANEQ